MTRWTWTLTGGVVLAAAWACLGADPTPPEVAQPADVWPPRRVCVAVFDFQGPGGVELADRVRQLLGKRADCEVVDALATRTVTPPPALSLDRGRMKALIARLAADVALWGQVQSTPVSLDAVICCVDASSPSATKMWTKSFTDSTDRAGDQVARQIVETLRAKADWARPREGEETEPNDFGPPLNVNGDFELGSVGWEGPDGVSTFLVDGPAGRGTVLRIRTDLARQPWLDYRRKLLAGQADPTKPPSIPRDTSTASIGGTEGVHYRSDWIVAEPGRRYWLTADVKCARTAQSFPRIFLKGFADPSAPPEGLPESSLAERGLTAEGFAALPAARRKDLIAQDVGAHPGRYRREVYRGCLACRNQTGGWTHLAAAFPSRAQSSGGGLPPNVQWLQVQAYAYWPPGEYLFDNVFLYTDPRPPAPKP